MMGAPGQNNVSISPCVFLMLKFAPILFNLQNTIAMNQNSPSVKQGPLGPLPKLKEPINKYREFVPPFPKSEWYGPEELPFRIQDISYNADFRDEDSLTGMQPQAGSFDIAELYDKKKKAITVDNYIKYRHTRQYVQQKHDAFFGTEKFDSNKKRYIRYLFSVTEFGRSIHLFTNLTYWKNLGVCPKVYFDYLGIDPDVLELVLEADTEEYLQLLQQPLAIDNFVVRYGAAM